MSNFLKRLAILVLTLSIWCAEAQDYKSDKEYEKLKSYASPSSFYPDGNSGQLQLLVVCVDRGDCGLLDKLLNAAPKFVNVNEGMSDCSPIHWAAFKGDTNTLALLLKHGADIKKKGTIGKFLHCTWRMTHKQPNSFSIAEPTLNRKTSTVKRH